MSGCYAQASLWILFELLQIVECRRRRRFAAFRVACPYTRWRLHRNWSECLDTDWYHVKVNLCTVHVSRNWHYRNGFHSACQPNYGSEPNYTQNREVSNHFARGLSLISGCVLEVHWVESLNLSSRSFEPRLHLLWPNCAHCSLDRLPGLTRRIRATSWRLFRELDW